MNRRPGMGAALRLMAQTGWYRVSLGFMMAVAVIGPATGWLPTPLRGLALLFCTLGLWILLFFLAARLLIQEMVGARRRQERQAVEIPDGLALRQIGLWLAFALVLALAQAAAGLPGLLAGALVLALVLPGATLVLVSGQSLTDALYPPEWLRFLHRLGWQSYLSLAAWLVFSALLYALLAGVFSGAPTWLRNALQMGWWSFSLLAWSACAGMLMHVHRPGARKPSTRRAPSSTDPSLLFDQVMSEGADVIGHRQLARQLASAGEIDRALAHAQVHVSALLLTYERPLEALEQADRVLALDADFCLRDPVVMRDLIRAARSTAPAPLTASLCRNYLQRFPASLVRADIALIACDALAEAGLLEASPGRAWLAAAANEDMDSHQRSRLAALREPLRSTPSP